MKCVKLLPLLLVLCPYLSKAQKFELINSGDVLKKCAALYDSGQYKQALALNKINRSDTNYVHAVYEKAISCEADSQYNEAIKYCVEALALKEQREWEPELYNTYGNTLEDLAQYDKARQVFDQAIAKYPSYAVLYFNKGIAYTGEKKWADAEVWFKKALLINPYMYSAHYQLGLAALNQGKLVPAFLSFLGYLTVNPEGKYWQKSLKYINSISRATDEIADLKNKRTINPDANYQGVEDIILSKMALDAGYKSLSTVDDPMVRQIQALFEKLDYSDSNNDFWIQYYLPYYKQVFNDGQFDRFIYHIFSNVNLPAIQEYQKKNKKQLEAFVNEAAAYFDRLRTTRELFYKKRDTVKQTWYFDNGSLAGRGTLTSNGKSVVGPWVAFYPPGNIKASGNYNDAGQRDGEWLFYFNTGRLKARETYKLGKLEGPAEFFFENGNLSSCESYADEKLDGPATVYYYAGNVKSTAIYRQGKKEGEAREYFSNGNLSSVANYTGGAQNGVVTEYYKNGLVKDVEPYANGKGEGTYKGYHDSGSLSAEGQVSNDKLTGPLKFYDLNGKVKEIRNYANDKEDGLHQEYFDNGQLSCTYSVKKGKNEGEADYYYKDGKIYSKYIYDAGAIKSAAYFDHGGAQLSASVADGNGISIVSFSLGGYKKAHYHFDKKGNLDGPDTLFYPSGKVQEINNYKDNDLDGPSVTYFMNGKKKTEVMMKEGKQDGYYTSYYANGKPEAEGWMRDGDNQGEWTYYDEHGRVTVLEYYLDGERDGYKEEYDAKGKKTLEEKYYRGWLEKLTQYDDEGNIMAVDSFPKASGKYVLYYPNKQKMTETDYVNGDFNGPYKTYFFDGSLHTSYFYKRGALDSTYRSFFYGGVKDWEGQYLRGNKSGLWKSYEEDGTLSETINYVNDQVDGEKIYYLPDGTKDYVAQYKNDELNGEVKKYDPDGTLMYQVAFEDDRANSYTYLGKDGKLVPSVLLAWNNGVMKSFYPSGKPSRETTYSDGTVNGHDVLYYNNGQLRSVDTSQYGLTEGLSTENYPNGKPKTAYYYKTDNTDGPCKEYYDTGVLKKDEPMDNGNDNGAVKYYDKNGKLTKTMIYDYGKLISVKNE